MIFADTQNNRLVFDIGPGDIGAGQRLVLSFLSGLTMSLTAPPRAEGEAENSLTAVGIARYLAVYGPKGQTA